MERCCLIYLNEDASLADLLLEGILKFWPFADRAKELCFIKELNTVLSYCTVDDLGHIVKKLFHRVVKCMQSGKF